MKVLVLSPLLPHEGVPHAGGHFLLHHLREIAGQHEVELYVPGVPSVLAGAHHAPAWLPLVVTPIVRATVPGVRDLTHSMRRRLRFRSLGSRAVRGLRDAGFLEAARDADIVELQWVETAILGRELRAAGVRTPIVVVAHDVTALAAPAFRRIASAGGLRELARRPLELVRIRAEVADLRVADLILVFKAEDCRALEALGVRTPCHVLEPSLDLPRESSVDRIARRVLFTGAMWRPENQHGMRWFLREVWPVVVAAVPDAELLIVGASPPAELRELAAGTPRATVTGTVEDMVPFYEGASAFVAPLFAPGGVKFKVPQAMVFDLPVVATPIAVQGLPAPRDALWAITDEPSAMADALVRLLRDPAAGARVGEAAGRWARGHFSFAASTQSVLERYAALAAARQQAEQG